MINRKLHPAIFQQYQSGKKIQVLAEEHNVTRQRINQIINEQAFVQNVKVIKQYKRPVDVPKELLEQYIQKKMTIAEIAAEAGCSKRNIYKKLLTLGYTNKHYNFRRHAKSEERRAKLYKEYLEGKSAQELAKQENMTLGSLQQLLCEHRRNHNLAHKNTGWDKT